MSITPLVFPVKYIIEHRIELVYPSHITYRVLIPVGEEIETILYVPEDYIYLVPGKIHDVPVDYFTHKCEKDGFPVLPDTLIDGTSMILNYPEPVIVEKYWKSVVRNVSHIYSPPGSDAIFRLRIPVLVIHRKVYERWVEEVRIEREAREILLRKWGRASLEEKIRLALEAPELLISIARD